MKKFIKMLINFFSNLFKSLLSQNNRQMIVHGVKVREGSREALVLASTHEVSAPRPSSLKEWLVGPDKEWALNAKNAIRKANNGFNIAVLSED